MNNLKGSENLASGRLRLVDRTLCARVYSFFRAFIKKLHNVNALRPSTYDVSILTQGNEIFFFSFRHNGNKEKPGLEFFHSTRNA